MPFVFSAPPFMGNGSVTGTFIDGFLDLAVTGAATSGGSCTFSGPLATSTAPRDRFSFEILAPEQTFGAVDSLTPVVTFPVTPQAWRARLDVEAAEGQPAASGVLFTPPTGSSVSGTLAADAGESEVDPYSAKYVSVPVGLAAGEPTTPPGGVWGVSVGTSRNASFTVAAPPALARLVVPFPTVTLDDEGSLRRIAWTWRNRTTGATVATPTFVRRLEIALHSGDDEIYSSGWLAAATTSHLVVGDGAWSCVTRLTVRYEDTLGHTYVVPFTKAGTGDCDNHGDEDAILVVESRLEKITRGSGTTTEQIVNVFFQPDVGLYESAVVSDGNLFSLTPIPHNGEGASGDRVFDNFNIRRVLTGGESYPPLDRQFMVEATPVGGGDPVSFPTTPQNLGTADEVTITGVNDGGSPVSTFVFGDVAGVPLTFTWSLAGITFPITELQFTAVANNADDSLFCHAADQQDSLSTSTTSGTITMPTECTGSGGTPEPTTSGMVCVFVSGADDQKTSHCYSFE